MKDNRYISASEISEYVFCNVSWYMDVSGYPRNEGSSKRFEVGNRAHRHTETVRVVSRRSGYAKVVSVATLIVVLLLIMMVIR
ncbi:hypothetical protein ApAK_05390 [Thermoplasmatales archaeon AK]|nr:hypothetical protein [Thermoplasmatales archaeon AK]